MLVHDDLSALHTPDPPTAGPQPPATVLGLLSDEDLEERLCSHAAHVAVAECSLCLMVAEVDRRGIWAQQGARSCAHWLSWRLGLSTPAGREHVRVGHALEALPRVHEAFSRGALSYSKVRALTRIATPATEARLVEMAAYTTASQLETITRSYRHASDTERADALEVHQRRSLHTYREDGTVVIRARLSPEDGATVLAAIEAIREEHRRDASAETPSTSYPHEEIEPGPASAADVLVAICEASLAHGFLLPSAHGPHASVVVHVDEEPLSDPEAPGCAYVEDVGAVSVHTVQRLACDARVSTVSYRAGVPVPVGRTRAIPLSLRRAVLGRDGGCRFPGCSRCRYVDVHHVVYVSEGGRTTLQNLTTICRTHHRMVHEGGYRLSMEPGGKVHVVAPDGRELPPTSRLPGARGPGIEARHDLSGLHVEPAPAGTDRTIDLAFIVDVLLQDGPP